MWYKLSYNFDDAISSQILKILQSLVSTTKYKFTVPAFEPSHA